MDNFHYSINEFIERYPTLNVCKEQIMTAYKILEECYTTGHKLLVAGNGGSCADSEHIVGELMKGFKSPRLLSPEFQNKLIQIDAELGKILANSLQKPLTAISLTEHQGLNTAFINDVDNGGILTFAQQILGYGNPGDVFLGISTSGNSKNISYAAITAKALGCKVIGLTGKDGGTLANRADCAIIVPCNETFMIQEYHLPIYHLLCLMLEEHFFNH